MSANVEVRPDEDRWQAWRAEWYGRPVEVPQIKRCSEMNLSDVPVPGLHLMMGDGR